VLGLRRGCAVQLIAFLLVSSPAIARDIVVDGGVPDAAAQVAVDAHVDASSLVVVTLPTLFAGRSPVIPGGGRVDLCGVAPLPVSAMQEAATKAESKMAHLEHDGAIAELDIASRALACLKEPITGANAARLYFLRGLAAYALEKDDVAKAAFRQAHAYDPAFTWDPRFPPDSQPLYREAAAAADAEPKAHFGVVPWPEGATIDVDGEAIADPHATVDVLAGEHLVQIATAASLSTVRVIVEPGVHAELILPAAVTDATTAWVATDPDDLGFLLAAATEPGDTVYVALPTGTWRREGEGFVPIATHEPPKPPKAASPTAWMRPVGIVTASAGALVAGGSLAVNRIGASKDATAEGFQAWNGRNEVAQITWPVGLGLASAGAALVGVSFALPADVHAWVGPRGIGLTLTR
jgi:hypothetical protein